MQSIKRVFQGNRPDITPAQVPGLITAVAVVLNVFGVYHLSDEQTAALIGLCVVVVGLFGADAKIRGERNRHDAHVVGASIIKNGVSSAAPAAPRVTSYAVAGEPGVALPLIDDEENLPTDEEEFASPPPSDDQALDPTAPSPGQWTEEVPVQPSEDGIR